MSSVNIGQVEKVTWIRQKDGTLLCVIAPFKAGAMDLAKMAMSPEGEAFI